MPAEYVSILLACSQAREEILVSFPDHGLPIRYGANHIPRVYIIERVVFIQPFTLTIINLEANITGHPGRLLAHQAQDGHWSPERGG